MMIKKFSAHEVQELSNFLKENYQHFKGKIIFLLGELGAGKTTFVRELAALIDPQAKIQSPSFNIMHVHPQIVHLDLYNSNGDLSLYEDYFEGKTVFIEWAEKIDYFLEPDVVIKITKDEENDHHYLLKFFD